MAQGSSDQSNVEMSDPEESSPNMIVYRRIEEIITRMQDDKTGGVPIRTVKSFLSKIPSVVTGADIVQWLMKNLIIEDPVEAIHLGSLIAAQGYIFPISDHVLTLKDDGTFYRFQAPYFWPSNCWEPENTDYAIYLCKRTMQNKARLELADYEAENLARLQRAFARKWEFIFMQAEAQVKIDRKKDKTERKILDSQERAFWDVHRPVPGCVNTTEMDIRKCRRMKNPQKVKKSVYGIAEDSQPQSPVHVPSQPIRKTTKEDFRKQITFLNVQIDRHCLKMSKVAESLIAYSEQYVEYDPFITPAEPSNPWLSDDTILWDIEMSKEPSQQRVKRWGFSMDEVLKDPVGRDQFLRFLESEFSSENLRFWLAVQDLKKQPLQDVAIRVEEIWQEFLAPGAQSAINLDSHSYERTSQNVKDPGRYTYEDAQEHIYKLMKSDSYARFLRSNAYQDLLLAKKKPENEQGRRTSLEKFTRSVCCWRRMAAALHPRGRYIPAVGKVSGGQAPHRPDAVLLTASAERAIADNPDEQLQSTSAEDVSFWGEWVTVREKE
ncbi:regulator of G-protein signaling 6 isoform X1 [Alligator mississippiensis]|uniref:regulator of G-protein signaling 6 isoform X1 n=1 Tax=Alligator mississippiensis TaxID=8496 RepID=UPI0028776A18|nr:regulator of G-protein signaling 6 isoform X1 [Alligator mississippiensis]XP_059578902.1 regulator of G-protein signaling 6 isoform X1 [Alligator mississippiensis]